MLRPYGAAPRGGRAGPRECELHGPHGQEGAVREIAMGESDNGENAQKVRSQGRDHDDGARANPEHAGDRQGNEQEWSFAKPIGLRGLHHIDLRLIGLQPSSYERNRAQQIAAATVTCSGASGTSLSQLVVLRSRTGSGGQVDPPALSRPPSGQCASKFFAAAVRVQPDIQQSRPEIGIRYRANFALIKEETCWSAFFDNRSNLITRADVRPDQRNLLAPLLCSRVPNAQSLPFGARAMNEFVAGNIPGVVNNQRHLLVTVHCVELALGRPQAGLINRQPEPPELAASHQIQRLRAGGWRQHCTCAAEAEKGDTRQHQRSAQSRRIIGRIVWHGYSTRSMKLRQTLKYASPGAYSRQRAARIRARWIQLVLS